ncbi:MAG: hypothetical protein JO013_12515 [Alphaproteobacteria bacterium]|nr:hypothetical protein [Alphaproteobacteria bacterium]
MIISLIRGVALSGTLLFAGPGSAAAPPNPGAPASSSTLESDPIVVTGQRERYARASNDVRSITRAPEDVLARFETPVCPIALGLPEPLARATEARIRTVAEQLNVAVAVTGCRPNLTVIVADDGIGAITALQKKMPNLFQTLTGAELRVLKTGSGPVWTWYEYDQRRRDGGPVEHITLLDGNPPRALSSHAYIASNVQLSRLSSPVRMDIMLAFVVIDSRAAEGLTAQQLADGAAVLGLSMIDYRRVPSLNHASALQLFADRSGRSRIDGMTRFDAAYLHALYSGESGLPASQRITVIAQEIVGTAHPTGLAAHGSR